MKGTTEVRAKSIKIGVCRVRLGLSMRELAKESGLSVSAISKIERGAVQAVRPLSAQKICSALGMDFDDLFTINTPSMDGAGEPQNNG